MTSRVKTSAQRYSGARKAPLKVPLLFSSFCSAGEAGNLVIKTYQHGGNIKPHLPTQNSPFVLFKRGEGKVAQCGGTEVRCGRGVRQTVGVLLSVRLEDGERCSDCLLGSGAALSSGLRMKPLPRKRRMQ